MSAPTETANRAPSVLGGRVVASAQSGRGEVRDIEATEDEPLTRHERAVPAGSGGFATRKRGVSLVSEQTIHLIGAALCAIVFFAFFEDLVIHTILNRSLISADDAFFAMVSKTLAFEGVYGLPLSSAQVSLFDPLISTGPPLLMPGALVMRVFGAEYWVPGATAHVLFLAQMAALFAILARSFGLGRSLAFVTALVALMQAMSGWRWYLPVYLGEAPAFGYLALGAGLLAGGSGRRSRAAAGVLFGLAYLTKQIVFFAGVGVVAAWALFVLGKQGSRALARAGATVAVGALAPILLFEAYRLVTLGFGAYADLLQRQVAMSSEYGLGREHGFVDRVGRFMDIVVDGYLLNWRTLVFIAVSAAVAVVVWVRSPDSRPRLRLAVFMWAGSATHLAYYLLFSTMFDRYLAIGVYLVAAAMAAPFLALDLRRSAAFAACLYLVIFLGVGLDPGFRSRSSPRPDQAEAVETVEALPLYPLVGKSWHSFFDVIYLLDREREWTDAARIEQLRGRAFVFVAHMPFTPRDDTFMDQISAKCRQVPMRTERYEIRVCDETFWTGR